MRETIASPSPVPCAFVEKYGSKNEDDKGEKKEEALEFDDPETKDVDGLVCITHYVLHIQPDDMLCVCCAVYYMLYVIIA